MIKNCVVDQRRWAGVLSEWRHDDDGNAEAQQHLTIYLIGVEAIGSGDPWRRDVLEEAAPFIEGDDENGVAPGRAGRKCLVDVHEEGVAVSDVRVGMIIVARSVVEDGIGRVNERDCGKVTSGGIIQEIGKQRCRVPVAKSPERQVGEIVEVIAMAHAGGGQAVEDSG